MKTIEVFNDCAAMLEHGRELGPTVDLFRAMYPYPLDDAPGMAAEMVKCDLHTLEALERKISDGMMDLLRIPLTRGELLMFRLRLENAVRILSILSRSQVPCEVCTDIREEGILWALTALWRAGRDLWIDRTAHAFRHGLGCALEPPRGE